MGKVFEHITDEIQEWIKKQNLFFISTAPLGKDGHINCSPKGADSFRILDDKTVAYLDLTGSGIETIAHLKENRRIVVMFCAFIGPPQITRLYGKGHVILQNMDEFDSLRKHFPVNPGTRSIIKINVTRVSTSCGYSVPFYEFQSHRDTLDKWAKQKGEEGVAQYRAENNLKSIDGLPGIMEEDIDKEGS